MASVNRQVLPGFSLTLGYTVFYLSILVLFPIAACFFKAASLSFDEFWHAVWTERARAAYYLTFGAAFIAAIVNLVLGLLLAWVLVRYTFPGKKVVDSLVDLPLALPTAVGGLVYAALYVPKGWLGQYLVPLGDPRRLYPFRHRPGARLCRPSLCRADSAADFGRPGP
jgi:sulfate/thiosulfate transport system permease protein